MYKKYFQRNICSYPNGHIFKWNINKGTMLTASRERGQRFSDKFPTAGTTKMTNDRQIPGGDLHTWNWLSHYHMTPDHPLPLSKTESSTQGEFSSWILLAFSRLRDSGEIEKSFKNKKTHGGPLCQVARVLFSLCSFNTSPLSTICILRAWHRLGSCTSGG